MSFRRRCFCCLSHSCACQRLELRKTTNNLQIMSRLLSQIFQNNNKKSIPTSLLSLSYTHTPTPFLSFSFSSCIFLCFLFFKLRYMYSFQWWNDYSLNLFAVKWYFYSSGWFSWLKQKIFIYKCCFDFILPKISDAWANQTLERHVVSLHEIKSLKNLLATPWSKWNSWQL